MYALVDLTKLALPEVEHQSTLPEEIAEGFAWWPLKPEMPSFDKKREVAVAGDLYADPETKTVRRLYIVREKTPFELAEQRGLRSLKMLSFSDQGMVRALEDIVQALMRRLNLSLDDLEKEAPEAVEKLRARKAWRAQSR